MKTIFVVVALAVLFFGSPTSANLIQNGSFELPGFVGNVGPGRQAVNAGSTDLVGWTAGGAGDVYVLKTPFDGGPSFNPAKDGSYYLDLSGGGSLHANVYQDFPTTPGVEYLLTFDIGSASTSTSATINFQIVGASTLLDMVLTPIAPGENGINWLEETFSFVPDSATTRLSFFDVSNSDDNASFVDNVSVIPEPASLALLCLGSLAFVRKRRR